MKIAFAGGGTGGHFYPLIAIAEAVRDITREERLIAPGLFYLADTPFDTQALFENEVAYIKIPAGKMRRYWSLRNFSDTFVTLSGIISALFILYRIFPDVVISTGSYASVPVTVAARILKIPVIIHESDAKPGRANLLASKWADRISLTFASSARLFPPAVQGKIARTGHPVRRELSKVEPYGAAEFLHLDSSVSTILIVGGSLGSERINSVVIAALADLVQFVNVIHQTGKKNLKEVESLSHVALHGNALGTRYHAIDYLNVLAMRQAAGAASVIISRAGAGAIAEISLWGKPAILIPIPEGVSHDQRTNAYSYAATGAAVVLEEANLTPHLLTSEIKRIIGSPELSAKMGAAGKSFTDADAARILAKEAISIGLIHEPAPSQQSA